MQRSAGAGRIGDHDGRQRFAERRLDRGLPPAVDAHEVEQRAEHAVETAESRRAGAGVGGVEDERRASTRPSAADSCSAAAWRAATSALVLAGRRLEVRLPPVRCRRASGDSTSSQAWQSCCRAAARISSPAMPLGQLVGAVAGTRQLVAGTIGGGTSRAQLATDLGDGARRRRCRRRVEQRQHALAGGGELLLVELEVDQLGLQLVDAPAHDGELVGVAGGVGLEAGDHVGVEQLAAIALQRPPALGDHRAEATCPLAQLLDQHEAVADVVVAPRGQLGAGRQDVGVERRELRLQLGFGCGGVELGRGEGGQLRAQRGDLAAGDVDAQRGQLADQLAVAARRLGLSFERAQLAADLARGDPGRAPGWPRWRRGGARPSPCACGT